MDLDPGFTDLGVLPCTLDAGIASRAAIGLLVLATDQTMEHEFRHLIRLPGVAVYQARLFNDADITPATLRAIGERIAPATELILPSLHLDVVAFGCTSASMALGEEAGVPRDPPRAARGCLHHAGHRRVRRVQGAGRATDRRADAVCAGGERRGARLPERARRRGGGVRDVRQARRSGGGADLGGFDRRGDRGIGARRAARCGVRVVHQPAPCGERRGDRGGGGNSGHLQRSRDGMALPAARGGGRHGAGAGRLFECGR